MAGLLQIRVYDQQQVYLEEDLEGPVEFGRQASVQEAVYHPVKTDGHWRVPIAPLQEDIVSRRHVLVEPVDDTRVRITNLSGKLPVRTEDSDSIRPSEMREMRLPAAFGIGSKFVRLQPLESAPMSRMQFATLAPGQAPASTVFRRPTKLGEAEMDIEVMIHWLESAMDVLESAATSGDFFNKAAQSVVEMVGLDAGRVLLREQNQWKTVAEHHAHARLFNAEWAPSRHVLASVCADKKTVWQTAEQAASLTAGSLVGISSVVAAPILSRKGDVIGVLYGDRRHGTKTNLAGSINKLEAMLVELLATGVATGLARQEQEKAVLAARVQFEQFFTPELSRQLAIEPDSTLR